MRSRRVSRPLLSAVLAAGTALAGAAGAPSAEPPLEAALHTLQGGDARAAAGQLEALTAREPGNARAWRALGSAALQLHQPTRALRAWQRALALEPDSPQVFYN